MNFLAVIYNLGTCMILWKGISLSILVIGKRLTITNCAPKMLHCTKKFYCMAIQFSTNQYTHYSLQGKFWSSLWCVHTCTSCHLHSN